MIDRIFPDSSMDFSKLPVTFSSADKRRLPKLCPSKPPVSKWKRAGAKTSKKVALKLTCSVCGKSHILSIGRSKKVEFV